MSTAKNRRTKRTRPALLDRAARSAHRALIAGSILLFICAFTGVMPVHIPALSTPALLGFTVWCLLVLAVMVTATVRVVVRVSAHAARAARAATKEARA